MTTADEKLLEVAKTNIANTTLVKMNVRSSLLDKKMQALTGTSPSDFIKIARLNHALKLLKSRKYSVAEISELCGFTSVGYFSIVFKKYFHQSPTDLFE